MMNIILILLDIAYIGLLVIMLVYARRQEKIFDEKIKKMTKEINNIIRFTENKQKEVERIKKRQAKNE